MSPQFDALQTFRRHRDGSIDFDHYRARAAASRAMAKRDTAKVRAMLQFVTAISFAAVSAVLVLNASAPVADATCRLCAQTAVAALPYPARAE